MGLAQKRIVQDYEGSAFTTWKTKFDKVCGGKMAMEVHWDTMQHEDYAKKEEYFAWFEKVYFRPLMTVFENICADEMGKKAVKTGVKKIVIDGTEGSNPGASKFVNGVFTVNHKFNTNVDDVQERIKKWQEMIEKEL